jgi:2Fe-2S ferredoxin
VTSITFIEFDGHEHVVTVEPGGSLMNSAKDNGVPGIDADCGGSCVCATCHVFISPDWQARIGAPTEFELSTLEFVEGVQVNSRLACQVKVTPELDGLVVRLPESQR